MSLSLLTTHIYLISLQRMIYVFFFKKNVMKAWFFQVSSRNSISSTVAIDNMWFWLIIFKLLCVWFVGMFSLQMSSFDNQINGLVTMLENGTATGAGNGTGNNGSWSSFLSRTSVNISAWYIRTHWSWSRSSSHSRSCAVEIPHYS